MATYIMSEYEPQGPEKRSFFDRLLNVFGDNISPTWKAVIKMVIVIAMCFGAGILADGAGVWAFGLNTFGHNTLIVFSVFGSFLLGRYAWVKKY